MAQASGGKPLEEGDGSFTFLDERGDADRPLPVWYHLPGGLPAAAPVLFVMHGSTRSGEPVRDDWRDYARQHGSLLVVPEFSDRDYPGASYPLGRMFDEAGAPTPEAKWAYSTVEHLFDEVKRLAGNAADSYLIFGNSAGGQFVHRMLLLTPGARIRRAVASNASFYALPTLEVEYPYGCGNTHVNSEQLAAALGTDFTLLLGELDSDPDDPNVDRSPGAMAQGRHRLERGMNFHAAGRAAADKLGVPFRWQVEVVPGAGHFYPDILPAAVPKLFR